MNQPVYKRILLKLSGESLQGDLEYGISSDVLAHFGEEIQDAVTLGVQVGIVIGGGNIYRGVSNSPDGIDKVTGDHMGMLGTVINALALQNMLEHKGVFTRLLSAIKMEEVAESFIRRRAVRHLEKGRVVIFGAGTGNPYFTTDTAAALRAVEIEADVIIKATRVDGVYDADPEKVPDAMKFDELTHLEILKRGLRIMDLTAITLCKENNLPIVVMDISKKGNLRRLLVGGSVGTRVVTST